MRLLCCFLITWIKWKLLFRIISFVFRNKLKKEWSRTFYLSNFPLQYSVFSFLTTCYRIIENLFFLRNPCTKFLSQNKLFHEINSNKTSHVWKIPLQKTFYIHKLYTIKTYSSLIFFILKRFIMCNLQRIQVRQKGNL